MMVLVMDVLQNLASGGYLNVYIFSIKKNLS